MWISKQLLKPFCLGHSKKRKALRSVKTKGVDRSVSGTAIASMLVTCLKNFNRQFNFTNVLKGYDVVK